MTNIMFLSISTEHQLSTRKLTSHLSDYLSREGGYRENDGEMLSCFPDTSLCSFLNKYMPTDIAVHVLKSDCYFKQNDQKNYLCWFLIIW